MQEPKTNKRQSLKTSLYKNRNKNLITKILLNTTNFKKEYGFETYATTLARPFCRNSDIAVTIDESLFKDENDSLLFRAIVHEMIHVMIALARKYVKGFHLDVFDETQEEKICGVIENIALDVFARYRAYSFEKNN